jgi:ABC-2 type transport system ATP-binding protein
MIKLDAVTKRYGGTTAVDCLSLSVPRGEVFAFLGPNGAGKTTTVKLLAGLLFPDSGKVEIAGLSMERETQQAKRLIGLIPDEPHVYPKLTAWEFLELVAGLYSLNGSWKDSARHYLEVLELGRALESRILLESFSHGMKQKVVLTAMLMRRPAVWLLDEPLVGLDPKSIRTVKGILREKAAKEGATVFLSTHVLSIAEEVADRVGIIQRGRLEFVGTKAELGRFLKAAHPETREGESLESLFLKATS